MVGRLYSLGKQHSRIRARELLAQFDLADAGGRPVKTYSGGMRRRLDLAASLVARPQVLFLDEPTTGLDPNSRTTMWEVIRELVSAGTTVLLTTQYLEEADRLADEIVVIDRGQAIARGRSDELKAQVGGERIELIVGSAHDIAPAEAVLKGLAGGDVIVDEHNRRLTAPVTDGATSLMTALRHLDLADIAVLDVGLRRPTLDDVFLTLTGRSTELADDASEAEGPTTEDARIEELAR